jgi:hypothetical protein
MKKAFDWQVANPAEVVSLPGTLRTSHLIPPAKEGPCKCDKKMSQDMPSDAAETVKRFAKSPSGGAIGRHATIIDNSPFRLGQKIKILGVLNR